MRSFIISTLIILACCCAATPSHALFGISSATKASVREAIEFVARKFNIELQEEAGSTFTRQAERFISQHGDEGVRALKAVGPDIIERTSKHGDDLVVICSRYGDDAARFLAKQSDDAVKVWRAYGKEGTDLLLRHPGIGKQLLDEFGKKGLEVGRTLDAEQVQKLLILGRKASPSARTDLIEAVRSGGDSVLDFLWSHKTKVVAGVGIYALLKDRDSVRTETLPDGSKVEIRETNSLLEKTISTSIEELLRTYPWITLVVVGLLLYTCWPLLSIVRRLVGFVAKTLDKLKFLNKTRKGDGESTPING